jgi:hypothetical protein
MTTVASTAPSPAKPWLKSLAAVLGTATMLAVLVIAFALPASRSGPHDVPIGVVGTPAQIVSFFDGHGATRSFLTLACYLVLGSALYGLGLARARRNNTVDVDRIEFDHRPHHTTVPPNGAPTRSTAITEPVTGPRRQQPKRQSIPAGVDRSAPRPIPPRQQPASMRDAGRWHVTNQCAPTTVLPPAALRANHYDRPRPRPEFGIHNRAPEHERSHPQMTTPGPSPKASALPPPWRPPPRPVPLASLAPELRGGQPLATTARAPRPQRLDTRPTLALAPHQPIDENAKTGSGSQSWSSPGSPHRC